MPFRPLLQKLCEQHQTIRGVIFCDEEGERIERLCNDDSLSEFDLDIAGASLATLMPMLANGYQEGSIRVLFDQDAYWIQLLVEGYFLLVVTHQGDGRDLALEQDLHQMRSRIISHM
ncbi:MAG: hypothetical protein GY822_07790 [Deltaproteobacteria bacterium]|nr:hypothetical protein [Deltaproteobacteria bacterium]